VLIGALLQEHFEPTHAHYSMSLILCHFQDSFVFTTLVRVLSSVLQLFLYGSWSSYCRFFSQLRRSSIWV